MIKHFLWSLGGGVSGWFLTVLLNSHPNPAAGLSLAIICGLLSLALSVKGSQFLEFVVSKKTGAELTVKSMALFCGLAAAALLGSVFRPVVEVLPWQGRMLVLFWGVLLTVGVVMTMTALKLKDFTALFFETAAPAPPKASPGKNQFKVVDTSAIIDGRIADLCKTGFLEGVLIIPTFVLSELQKIADSADPLRRNRGRRGLDILNKIQKENLVAVRIFDRDYDDLSEVDTKLLRLSRELEAKVVTNDYNLNKVAELYGVQVLNINDLSNAIKPVVIPGEEMMVHVLRDGKEHGQGIGYLEDGTMIVVEGGKSYIGLDIEILVTSILQTSAGRMIFAKPKEYLASRITS
ncbi:PIN/TRAM domain-containing protein [Hydrogenispora ethanolica]|jgi:uncharacterized protein YacL|nr:PIN domain-containing protein [Hydrogenispora ethanolica]